MSGYITSALEGFGVDYVTDKWNEYASENLQTKDPYIDKNTNKKLKAPEGSTKQEAKLWKKIQKKAWVDDKCFMGCYSVDLGIGLGPIVVLLPGIGPLLMYVIHLRLVTMADPFNLPPSLIAKMNANIIFDFLITLPPIIGSFLSWLNGCSTRNAAMVHTHMIKMVRQRESKNVVRDTQLGNLNHDNWFDENNSNHPIKPTYQTQTRTLNHKQYQGADANSHMFRSPNTLVSTHQQSGVY